MDERPIRAVGTLGSNLIQLTSSTFFRMGTHRINARGSGRPQLLGTARPRAGADIQRLGAYTAPRVLQYVPVGG